MFFTREKKLISEKEKVGNFLLEYTLTENIYNNLSHYNIMVTKTENRVRETKIVRDITTIESKAYSIFKLIRNGLVTPFGLRDTIEDILS